MIHKTCVAYLIALRIARRSNLTEQNAEDCAIEFFENEVIKAGSIESLFTICQESPALINKCAADYVKNFIRCDVRRNLHAVVWPRYKDCHGNDTLLEFEDMHLSPEAEYMLQFYWKSINSALEELTIEQASLFLRHHLNQESISEIAASIEKTPNSVAVSLFRIRAKLLVICVKVGLSAEFLYSLLPAPPPQKSQN